MKRYSLALFFLIYIISFGTTTNKIEKYSFNSNSIIFNISGNSFPKYLSNYDSESKIIFLEFSNTTPNKNIKNKILNGNYISKIETVSFDKTTDFFITLKSGVEFLEKKLKNPNRFQIIFSKKTVKNRYTIVIDPGHGGKDPGATGYRGLHEKDIVLKVGKLLKKKLSKVKKFNVIMTRNKDVFIPLGKRADIGNKNSCDLFISIHANANKKKSANGVEVFYFSKKSSKYAQNIANFENSVDDKYGIKSDYAKLIVNDIFYHMNQEKSIDLSSRIENKINKLTGLPKRGTFGANFAVLRLSNSPALLVELGFITNKSDALKLKNSRYQVALANAIYYSIVNYFN
ncbi:N-acetylmuramoyl-L-alanine amidase family protein [Haliovirga abyssi]|uniref:N-acetylmuramoyl-L-alanine amidase n=1 Tax=Haliovirga abyssi TaxID=2996794 RepID=A0AAU9DSP3_9FUSO|nr:N-acetylmuramoyl-L-alanine amidase [Haliovirga abyssi]BDU50079.1 N-acetylmuramoyl-L-alanine amidase [Haliovirga abyssi]